jgi:putative DNA primase/helicase
MSAGLDRLRDALKAHDCEPNERGEAKCPAHDDQRASLSFRKGDKGTVVKCHKGCSTEAVVEALGLKMGDLFDEPRGPRHEVARYAYSDENGDLLFEVVRFEPKDFRQRRPDGNGGWIWKLGDTRRVLYRLPAVLEAVKAGRTVFVVEGEKDVNTLLAWGLDATCNPMGAGKGKWRDAYSEALRGARVVVIPDADKEGRDHAAAVLASLAKVAAEVRVVELPGAKDATAWAAAGGTREMLERLCAHGAGVGVLMCDVKPERVRWLWERRIPLGKLTVLDGDPGQGKSSILLDLAARVSTGREMPDGSPGPSGGAVVLTAEDGLGDTVRPRLEAAGADLSRIVALVNVPSSDGPRPVTLPDDLEYVKAEIARVGAVLVVVDPMMAFLTGKADAHRDQDVRRALVPLAVLAEETGAAVVLIRHLVKSGGVNPLYRGGGSIGIVGACRSGLLVMQDPEIEGARILTSTKSNLSAPPVSLAYRLEAVGDVLRVRWLGSSEHTATSLLAAGADQEERGATAEAKAFLQDLLRDGPRLARDVKREAEAAGLSWRTVERAKGPLGIIPRKAGNAGGWSWELKTANLVSKTAMPPRYGGLGGLGGLVGSSSSFLNGSSESADEDRQDRHSPSAGGLEAKREPEVEV